MIRTLIVDNNQPILVVLSVMLKVKGFEPVPALGGATGVQALLSGEHFDIMLCDIRMEEVDGMEVLELARKRHPDMPVIMLTGYADPATAKTALELGAFDYLLKPFQSDQLVTTIKRALECRSGA